MKAMARRYACTPPRLQEMLPKNFLPWSTSIHAATEAFPEKSHASAVRQDSHGQSDLQHPDILRRRQNVSAANGAGTQAREHTRAHSPAAFAPPPGLDVSDPGGH